MAAASRARSNCQPKKVSPSSSQPQTPTELDCDGSHVNERRNLFGPPPEPSALSAIVLAAPPNIKNPRKFDMAPRVTPRTAGAEARDLRKTS